MEEEIASARKKTFVPVQLDANTIIRIEATILDNLDNNGNEEYVGIPTLPSFDDITNFIKGVSQAIVGVWEEVKPSKASVEFGVEVGFEAGKVTGLLIQGSGKANLQITLEWEKPGVTNSTNKQ